MPLRYLLLLLLTIFPTLAVSAQQRPISPRGEQRIQQEVRHQLWLLPFVTVFDNLEYKVDDGTVTLMGQVVNPVNKTDVEKAVKSIEGVERVDNRIEILPVSQQDDHLRSALFRALYGYPSLERYNLGVIKPIRIIVKNGHVTLEGVVDSQADKDTAGLRANGVPGIFSVTNNLEVQKS